MLKQGSPDWHEWRRNGIGSSDAPVIMGVSPWKSIHELWREKVEGVALSHPNPAQQRGLDLEHTARLWYENVANEVMQPATHTHPQFDWMRASLDGVSFDGQRILEIKCPGKADHEIAMRGHLPEKYIPQVQHLLAVSGAHVCDYFSFDGKTGVIVSVAVDHEYIAKLIEAEAKFWEAVCTKTPPEGGISIRDDAEWLQAANEYRKCARQQADAEAALKAAREHLESLAGDKDCQGAGITLTRVTTKGNVDYAAIPQLAGVDLEVYRKKSRTSWRLTLQKDR